jgi:hypothetical protein
MSLAAVMIMITGARSADLSAHYVLPYSEGQTDGDTG